MKSGKRGSALPRICLVAGLTCVFMAAGASPALTAAPGSSRASQRPEDDLEIGTPIITGSDARVMPGGSTPNAFAISFSFGELSPLNQNLTVRILIPITVRVSRNYEITLRATPANIPDPNAVQLSDVGVGLQNLRLLGPGACAGIITPTFNNDPSSAMTINPVTFRATYPQTLANIIPTTVVISGPRLPPQGAAFNLIFACAPQFYTPGTFSFVVTVTLRGGPPFTCP
ncbi:MAG TPA: hypothetical protein VJH03_07035 [Blastocatellia bacterium]|nr:hypothetical protein [Blastocatellia bacterium]